MLISPRLSRSMWHTTTSPPCRRRRTRAWVRRSRSRSWLARPVWGSAMESCQSWSYFPRGGPPVAGASTPTELNSRSIDSTLLAAPVGASTGPSRPVGPGGAAESAAPSPELTSPSCFLAFFTLSPSDTDLSLLSERRGHEQSRKSSGGLQVSPRRLDSGGGETNSTRGRRPDPVARDLSADADTLSDQEEGGRKR